MIKNYQKKSQLHNNNYNENENKNKRKIKRRNNWLKKLIKFIKNMIKIKICNKYLKHNL